MGNYWVNLQYESRKLGVAFLLARRYLVTANHCLRGLPEGEVELMVDFGVDGELRGRVVERFPDADIALIWLTSSPQLARPLQADRCNQNDRWQVPSRPAPNDPQLHGVVQDNMPYMCEGGAEIEALQLRSEVELGDYSGYSGGPVERLTGESRTLAGVLLEEYPDRQNPDRASGVLFAATIHEVIGRFDSLDMTNLMRGIGGNGESPAQGPHANESRQTEEMKNVLADAGATVQWLSELGLRPDEFEPLRLRVARSVAKALGRSRL